MICRSLPHCDGIFGSKRGEVPLETEVAFVERYIRSMRPAIQANQCTYWIAETSMGELVAQMGVYIVRSTPRPSRISDQWGYLTDCYTRPSFRGRGVGRDLLAQIATWATSRDLEMLLVWPSESSTSFYARAGFLNDREVQILRLRGYDAPPTGP